MNRYKLAGDALIVVSMATPATYFWAKGPMTLVIPAALVFGALGAAVASVLYEKGMK